MHAVENPTHSSSHEEHVAGMGQHASAPHHRHSSSHMESYTHCTNSQPHPLLLPYVPLLLQS